MFSGLLTTSLDTVLPPPLPPAGVSGQAVSPPLGDVSGHAVSPPHGDQDSPRRSVQVRQARAQVPRSASPGERFKTPTHQPASSGATGSQLRLYRETWGLLGPSTSTPQDSTTAVQESTGLSLSTDGKLLDHYLEVVCLGY